MSKPCHSAFALWGAYNASEFNSEPQKVGRLVPPAVLPKPIGPKICVLSSVTLRLLAPSAASKLGEL